MTKKKIKYAVVRSYGNYNISTGGYYAENRVQNYFDNGWQYKSCHEVKVDEDSTALEYVLFKEVE